MSNENKTVEGLSASVALAKIIGSTPEQVQEAEKSGTLDQVVQSFENEKQVFTVSELGTYANNVKQKYIKQLLDSNDNDIPGDLYKKVKGTVMEQFERKIKRSYDFDGDYENAEDLVNKVIFDKSKKPADSKPEDLQKIKELTEKLNDFGDVMQKNQKFVQTIEQFEQSKQEELNSVRNKYQSMILDNRLSGVLDKIPFRDESEDMKEAMKNAFITKLNNTVEFKFDENDNLVPINIETKEVMQDNKLEPLSMESVISGLVEKNDFMLKQVKQGDNIVSTNGKRQVIKSQADAAKYITDNNITDLNAQSEVYGKAMSSE
jgi:hypothetical protein